MERSEKTEKRWCGIDEMLKREMEEENEEVLVVSLGQEVACREELEVSDTEDVVEQGHTPLITACLKGMTEVSYCISVCVHVCVKEIGMRMFVVSQSFR